MRNSLLKSAIESRQSQEGESSGEKSAKPLTPIQEKYLALTRFCIEESKFISTLAMVVDVKVYDSLQDCLAGLCSPYEMLEVIKSLLREEFERKAVKEPGSILRGASLAAKMSSRHARSMGTAYLRDLLSDWIAGVENLPEELNVENPEGKAKLLEITNQVIEVMSDEEKISEIPYVIKEMCRLIGSLCDKYLPDQKWPLVGGLLLLRLYCPTIISPTTYGLLEKTHPMTPKFRKNLMQVTRLLQNASNHQRFKDGPNVALNEWVEQTGGVIDGFLEKVIRIDSSEKTPEKAAKERPFDEGVVLKFVQLFVQHKVKLLAELEGCDEEFKPKIDEFSDKLSACGNPFRTRTGTVAKASEALNLSFGNMASKRQADMVEFQKSLEEYKFPGRYTKDYFANGMLPKEKTFKFCSLISNDKHGVPCAPKIGKKENHLVFVGRDGVEWLQDNLKLTEEQSKNLLQCMMGLELVIPWGVAERKRKDVKFEDGDKFYWFDYAVLLANSGKPKESAREQSDEMVLALASLQLEDLGKTGILESLASPNDPEVSSRDQWRMLLTIAYQMTYSYCPVVKSKSGDGEEEPTFSEKELDNWTKKFLGFKSTSHTSELLKVLISDGFVQEKAPKKYGFPWQKIKQWNDKTFSSSAKGIPQVTPRVESMKSPKMSLRGKFGSSMRSIGISGSDQDAASDSQTSPKEKRASNILSPKASFRRSAPDVRGGIQKQSGDPRQSVQIPLTSTPAGAPEDDGDESSGERKPINDDSEEGDVSMMDFLNQDPDEVKNEFEKKPPPRPLKDQKSGKSLKNLFAKKDKDGAQKRSSSGGLLRRNK